MKRLLGVVAASGLLIGLSAISYTQQVDPPSSGTAGSGSAAKFGTGANGRRVVERPAPTASGSGDVVERGGGGRCKTQT